MCYGLLGFFTISIPLTSVICSCLALCVAIFPFAEFALFKPAVPFSSADNPSTMLSDDLKNLTYNEYNNI